MSSESGMSKIGESSTTRRKLSEARAMDSAINEDSGGARAPPRRAKRKDQSVSIFWKSAFSMLSKKRRRDIICNMWHMPIAAHNLAARAIQSAYRGYVLRGIQKKLGEDWFESVRGTTLQDRLRRSKARKEQKHRTCNESEGGAASEVSSLEEVCATYGERWYGSRPEGALKALAASRIQGMFRRFRSMRRMRWYKYRVYHIAAAEIQFVWRAWHKYREERSRRHYDKSEIFSARMLQKWYRRSKDRAIYRSLRDIVNFRNQGDPILLLKSVSPDDAAICDAATKTIVRLRLGGERFPPQIYFKVFTQSAVCDVNAFAPRDYSSERLAGKVSEGESTASPFDNGDFSIRVGRTYFRVRTDAHGLPGGSSEDTAGWYRRWENNGWRRISAATLEEMASDPVTIRTSAVSKPRLRRRNDVERERKQKRREWMRKLYTLRSETKSAVVEGKETSRSTKLDAGGDLYYGDGDIDDVLAWTDSLDFDAYMSNWRELGTSSMSDFARSPRNDNGI